MDWSNFHTTVLSNKSWRNIPVRGDLQRTRTQQSHDHPAHHRSEKRHRHNKYIPTIGAVLLSVLFPTSSLAETVGGVSATASPVANSSGSVTNQAIQVLQGPYITNTYGGGIQCQGPTLNVTPFITGSLSQAHPYEPYYNDPVYDMSDLNDDGVLDNPGNILYHVPTRTGQKNNTNLSLGFSATWSNPLDKTLQDQCKKAAATQIALQQQLTANKRLDFGIARLKNCGELLKSGISFHPKSPYYSICADVVVQNVTVVKPHVHTIPKPTSSSSPVQTEALQSLHSSDAALLGAPLQTRPLVSYP